MKFNFIENIIFENDNVRMEPLTMYHYKKMIPVVNDNPDLLKFSPPKFGTPELLKLYIEGNLALKEANQKYPFAIFDKKHNEYAGSTSYLNISDQNKRLEIGSTWLGEKFQRTGLNRQCKFWLMTYAFEKLGAERLEFKTDGRNKQSQKAIEAIGAKYEGVLRSHTLMSDGFRRDTVYYSVLKGEWAQVKRERFLEKGIVNIK